MRLVGPPYTAGPRPGSCRGARSRDQDVITDLAFRGVCLQGSLPSEWGLGRDEGDMESCVHRTARYGTRGRYLGTFRKTQSWGDSWGNGARAPLTEPLQSACIQKANGGFQAPSVTDYG